MNADLKLSGDSLREAVQPWLDELGKSDRERLKRLLDLSQTANTRLSDCLASLFPDDDTPTALANLTRLRKRLNDAADGDKGQGKADLGLRFHVDTKKKSPPSQRFVWFTGPDAAVLRATRFSEQVTSDIAGKPLISSKGIATTGSALAAGKRVVRFFISYAHDNKGLAETLVSALRSQFGPSRRYQLELWIDREIMVGEKWHERIQRAIAECDFGLFMVSPDFLGSDYIGENELPPFLSNPNVKPVVPVGLVPVSFSRHDLKGLQENQIFFLRGRSFDQMRQTAEKTEFARHLHEEMEKRLDARFAPQTGSRTAETADGAASDAPRGLSVEDALEWMPRPEETRHFQRTKGFPHHLAARESLDPAKAPPGAARDALEELEAWAVRADGQPFFALLGEVGIGKTTTLKQFTRQLLEKRRKQPRKYPLPIYIDLRDYIGDRPDAVPTIEELLASVIQRSWRVTDRNVTAADLLRLVREDGALILFDGLDEKIVHLTQDRARQFIRTLWSVLPQAMLAGSDHSRGKMLLSCRSHYFRDVWSQNAMLTGEDREGIDHAQYPAFCLLPFDEAQIRAYLTSFLGDEKHGLAAFDLIASIHNLRDLAQRPYLLSLISGHLGELEALQLRGDTVNAARLYDLVVRSWLNRDGGKHHLEAAHKRRLMEALAAALWRSGEKQWEVDRLEDWFDDFLLQNPAISLAYANKDRALLKEDLRTATFVLRPDTEEKSFRFAHTSLQEYFLAAHLVRALREQAPAAWDLPLVSLETFEFLGQILILEPTPQAIESMGRVLGGDCVPAALLAFKYWLHAIQKGYPEPNPGRVNLAGADLEEWHVQGHAKDRPLNLRGANLRGSRLNRARIEFVDLAAADLTGCEARQALFLHVDASHAKLIEADVAGLQWRHGSLENAKVESTSLELADLHLVGTKTLTLLGTPRAMRSLCHPQTYTGHRSEVHACAWHPKGAVFASSATDGTIKVWEAATGKEMLELHGDYGGVTCCAWSPDGSRLVSGTDNNMLSIWDVIAGKAIATLQGHTGEVLCCAWSPDGSRIASGSEDGTLKIWSAATGSELSGLSGHDGQVLCCSWSPDGAHILSGSDDKTLKIWDMTTLTEKLVLQGHVDSITFCSWCPDGIRIASTSWDRTLKIWDAANGKEQLSFAIHSADVGGFAWSADGLHLQACSENGELKTWDTITGIQHSHRMIDAREVGCCAWHPNTSRLLTTSLDDEIHLWDVLSGKLLVSFKRYTEPVVSVAWSHDGDRLACGSGRMLRIQDAANGGLLWLGSTETGWIRSSAWSPDGARLLYGSNNCLRILNAATGRDPQTVADDLKAVGCCGWSHDGLRIAASSQLSLRVWDVKSGKSELALNGHSRPVRCCAWSPDDTRLMTGSSDRSLKLWDASTGELLLTMTGHSHYVWGCDWSPDGSRVVSASWDGTLRIWNSCTGVELSVLTGHKLAVWCCAWSPDGSRVVSGSSDSTVKIWDASTGQEVLCLKENNASIRCCAWSPDGTRIVSGSWDHTLKVWDAQTGACLWTAHLLPEGQTAVIDGTGQHILHATSEAWRWLGWEERDARGRFIRRLPAEVFGPIPGMDD